MSDLEAAMTRLEGMRFQSATASMAAAEVHAACRHNMDVVGAWTDVLRGMRTAAEAIAPDRSVGGMWRRAFERSLKNAEKSRHWKARALSLNPEPLHNAVALSGMAPMQFEEAWVLAVAIPQPDPRTGDHRPIEDVVIIHPKTGKAEMLFDAGATHVSPPAGYVDRLPVFTDAKAWARQIALERLEWVETRKDRERLMQAPPVWTGFPKAALLLCEPKKMRWSNLSGSILEVPADMRETVRRALFAEARLPRVEGRA